MKKKGLSLGSWAVLCLTLLVVGGSGAMFLGMGGDAEKIALSAREAVGGLGQALLGPTNAPMPQSTVRTVTVTLAPTAQITPAPTEAAAVPTHPVNTSVPQGPGQVREAAPQEAFSFTLTAAGLAGFHSDLSDAVYNKTEKTFDYAPVLSGIGGRVHADLNTVLLPHTLNVTDLKYGDVKAPVAILDALQAGGFDTLMLGTEHALDQDVQGCMATVDAIAQRGMSSGGVNAQPARQNQIIQINGGKVALLSYTNALTNKGKNVLEEQRELMSLLNLDTARQDIAAARAQGAGCVVVFVHWGAEDAASVTKSMKDTAKALGDMGADVILGSHPSRVLPVDMLSCQDPSGRTRQVLVAYSLGTLLTESREPYDISGMLLHLNLSCKADGEVDFLSVTYTPTYIWRQSINGKMQYRVVCSADAPPEGMEKRQQEVMGRALKRVQETLEKSPVVQQH